VTRCPSSTIAGVFLAVVLVLAPGSDAAAEVSKDAAAQQVEESFSVEVLKVRDSDLDGTPVWLVTFMVPGGNSNAAFQVSTVAVEKSSGRLLPSFRHRNNGVALPGSRTWSLKSESRPEASGSHNWR